MASIIGKVALVTGASSGIGHATVLDLIREGVTVYAAARRVDKMKELEAAGAKLVAMDVSNEESMSGGVEQITAGVGRIDILVNNAGYGSYGAIEDVPMDEARRQFDVNMFGVARLTQLVLPGMRERGYGKIVNISSMGGKVYTTFGGWYHATKHALEGWSDCLRLETRPFGIDVIVIEPGGIKTPWGSISADNLRDTSSGGAYEEWARRTAEGMDRRYRSRQLSPPEVVSRAIVRSLRARRPRTRYAVGFMAKPSIFMRGMIGDRLFDRIVTAMV